MHLKQTVLQAGINTDFALATDLLTNASVIKPQKSIARSILTSKCKCYKQVVNVYESLNPPAALKECHISKLVATSCTRRGAHGLLSKTPVVYPKYATSATFT